GPRPDLARVEQVQHCRAGLEAEGLAQGATQLVPVKLQRRDILEREGDVRASYRITLAVAGDGAVGLDDDAIGATGFAWARVRLALLFAGLEAKVLERLVIVTEQGPPDRRKLNEAGDGFEC